MTLGVTAPSRVCAQDKDVSDLTQEVEAIIRTNIARSWSTTAADLNQVEGDVFNVLKTFLTDRQLGYHAASVMIASAALPTAGNIFIIAQHYGVAPQRVSAAILVSTAVSIVTVSLVIAWVTML